MITITCPICKGTGKQKISNPIWKAIDDKLSGYIGYEYRNTETNEIKRHYDIPDLWIDVDCCNCKGNIG